MRLFFLSGDDRCDDRRDRLLVYSLQTIGRRDYANEHQSQRNVWRGYMYCVIRLLLTSHCLR